MVRRAKSGWLGDCQAWNEQANAVRQECDGGERPTESGRRHARRIYVSFRRTGGGPAGPDNAMPGGYGCQVSCRGLFRAAASSDTRACNSTNLAIEGELLDVFAAADAGFSRLLDLGNRGH